MFVFSQSADTFAPSKPGTPAGSSATFDSIDLSWQASTDNGGGPLTYRVYRDGALIDDVTSASTGTVEFTDQGLDPGSTHVYTVDAVDGAGNVSAMSDPSGPITVLAPDGTPPTDPGVPTATSDTTTTVDLAWAASTDDESEDLTYRVFRDDPSNLIDEFVGPSSGTISFTDEGRWPGQTHTYWVQAVDGAGNASAKVASGSVQVTAAVFADDFAGGIDWTTVTRLTADPDAGSPAPSVRGAPTAQSAFAFQTLPQELGTICVGADVNVVSLGGTGMDLIRLRTVGGGPVIKVNLDTQRRLVVRSDFEGRQVNSGDVLPAGWNRVQLCGSVGAATTWDLLLNGETILADWAADTGTVPVGRVQVGDTAAKTWVAGWDDVIVGAVPE
jgi:hypothetical protein